MQFKKEKVGEGCENCRKTIDLIPVILDDEATVEQRNYFRSHIDECKKCFDQYSIEKGILENIKAKLQRKCCPDALLGKIRAMIKDCN